MGVFCCLNNVYFSCIIAFISFIYSGEGIDHHPTLARQQLNNLTYLPIKSFHDESLYDELGDRSKNHGLIRNLKSL